ncbi:S9 family peptidase [Microbacterium sp. NPDC076911]|uniref:S9 family peptidase n=1 Tax=Microbacterium sp. NPDC076911 TaxID=3154958 RepID=UPI0034395A4A
MRAQDIETLVSVGRPTLAADATFAIFATSRPDVAANRDVGQLWRVELPAGTLTRMTRGVSDSSPQLSPTDASVAFLRADAKGKPQVYVVAATGGEPVQTSDAPLGVSSFGWSPAGDSIAFVARVAEPGRYGDVEGLDASAEAPRHITSIRWHANGLGYTGDRPAHVFIVDAPDLDAEPFYEAAPAVVDANSPAPEKRVLQNLPRQLTFGMASHAGVVFSEDGTEILTVPDLAESTRRDLRSRLIAVAVDGTGEREIVGLEARLSIGDVAIAHDGGIALLAHELPRSDVDFVAPMVGLWAVDEGAPRRLTDATLDLGEVGSHVTCIDGGFLVQDRTHGRLRLVKISATGDAEEVLGGNVEVTAHAAAAGTVVVAVQGQDSYGELVAIEGGEARTLTSFGAAAGSAGIVVPRELTIEARDGYPVHGWVATPAGDGPFPVILQIHGGPYASYGIHLFDETQVLVDAGYAVVYCNPRGSAGYGREHGLSIRGQMGTVDFADVIDFLDAAMAADSRLDSERVGVMGGSYGGYLTAWIIAHDHRFAAAIVERGFLDPVSFQGTSDIGTFFGDEYVGVDTAAMIRQSPMAVVEEVSTPTFVVHSELDFRCPLEQATRYFSALKRNGVDAEMLIFPGENHELTRAGQPRHRVQRFEAVLAWWARYLPAQ